MSKLFSALLAGAITIALTPAASAQAYTHIRQDIITPLSPDARPMVLEFEEDSLERFWPSYQARTEAEAAGSPPWMAPWVVLSDVFNDGGWHPKLTEGDAPAVIRDFAPWSRFISTPSPAGTSDRLYEDLLLGLSIREDAWGNDRGAFDIINERGASLTPEELQIPEGWVVTGACLGRATVWYGDMGVLSCVDGYSMRPLIDPPRRPHHP